MMYPEQSSQQQQYHPPPPPPHHHPVGMPPPATHYHHPPQAQAPYYEQDPSWRNNGGVGLGENQVDLSSCTVKLGDEGDARYSQYPPMQGYAQQGQQQQMHLHYPPAPPYYPAPPGYGNRPTGAYPESWMAVHPSYMPHYDDKNHPYYPPPPPPPHYPYGMSGPYYHHSSSATMLEPSPVAGVGGSGEPYHATMDTTKRRKHAPPAASNEPSKEQKVCHLHQYPSSSSLDHRTTTSTSSSSLSLTTKSARRKKKMYSDFVGVTYNKTHAKYQACITHYRKQHYLGRYKLAVDAALAYDESARLLKGTSWKVNFQSRQEYEKAKAKELASVVGRNGGKAVDVAGSLAAVASKVEEIASTVAMSSSSGGVMIRRSLLPIKSEDSSYPLHEQRSSGSNEEDEVGACDESETSHVAMKGWTTSTAASTELPPPDDKSTSLNTTKVTPSPTLPISPPMISSEQQQVESVSSLSSQFIHEQLPSSALLPEETPLPVSPNPTRHALGNEKNTPDSVIRPKVLTYRPGGTEIYPLSSSEVVSSKASPLQHCQSTIQEKDAKIKVGSTTTARHFSTEKSHNIGTSITTTTAMKAEPVTKSPRASAPPPPVIQNGTLAAASALMTLFGNERSPQD